MYTFGGALALVKEEEDKESRSQEVDKEQKKDEKRTVVIVPRECLKKSRGWWRLLRLMMR
jgi:hypothetical protein